MEAVSPTAHTRVPPNSTPSDQLETLLCAQSVQLRHAADAKLYLQVTELDPVREPSFWRCACRDATGTHCELHLYNYEVTLWKCPASLKPGAVVFIKGPLLIPPNKVEVYHPSDIEVLHPDHPRLSHLSWLSHKAWVPSTLQDVRESYSVALGDRLYKKGREAAAHFVYSRVLDRDGCMSSWEGRVVLARQMVKQEYYEDALALLGEGLPQGDEKVAAEIGRLRCEAWQALRCFEEAAKGLASALQTNKKHLRREISEAAERAAESVGDLPSIPELRDRVDAQSGSVEVGDFLSSAIEVEPIEGKGNGMMAVKCLRQGDVVLMERALVCGEDHTQARSGEKEATVAQRITQLAYRNPKHIGARVKRLCGITSSSSDDLFDARDFESICAQNMFQLEDVEPELRWIRGAVQPRKRKRQKCALFAQASFFNHSCAPNCFRINVGDVIVVRAARHIPAGTELTISYVPIDATPSERARSLEKWSFVCKCSRCQLDNERKICPKSLRLRAIQQQSAPLLKLIETKPKQKSPKVASQLLDYCRQLEKAWRAVELPQGFEDLVFPFMCAGMSAGARGDFASSEFCWQTALSLLGFASSNETAAQSQDEAVLTARFIDPLTAFALGQLVRLGKEELREDFLRLFELLGGCRSEMEEGDGVT